MSSSEGSAREKEIIEKQRRLAKHLEASRTYSRTRDSLGTTKSPPKAGLKHESKGLFTSTSAVGNIDKAQKRPSRSTTEGSGAVANVLAAARAKASKNVVGTKSTAVHRSTETSYSETQSGDLQKRKGTARGNPGMKPSSLANLVKNATSTDHNQLSSHAFGTNVTPNDFWKNLRNWDFTEDLASQRRNERSDNALQSSLETGTETSKKIPDTFISSRHYVASWAPLCLAESRAQLLSEVLTECGQGPRRRMFVDVGVETTWKTSKRERRLHSDLVDMDSCHVQLKTLHRADSKKFQCFAHDLFCLLRKDHKDIVECLLRGSQSCQDTATFKNLSIVGHVEVGRKELDGLILKISKRKWAQLGESQMTVFRIGGNITALREFTALCGIESTPLKRFLLGHHIGHSMALPERKKPQAPTQKSVLLKKMGGVQALGRGFTEYAKKKFNPSQLMAISASSVGYGDGGFTLIKGPPGTGKTTTLVAILNSLHIRQYNKYYEEVRRIASMHSGNRQAALGVARRAKPRLLVCAPSNAAVDNIILKIMKDGFIDGSGQRYNPSMVRVGTGQSAAVRNVALGQAVDQIMTENLDLAQLESSIAAFRIQLQRISADIVRYRRRCHAIASASEWPLSKDWEIRVDEAFDESGLVYFVNHKTHSTTFECPPPPEPGESQFPARSMPEYRAYMQRIVKSVESYFSVKSNLERSVIVKGSVDSGSNHFVVRQSLESHVLNSVHIVMTTLGSAGSRVFEAADKFEVVVIDEAAQSIEPATLSALQLGSRHCVLVGDPQQLPATIFNVSGRRTKFDRSLFQRLEEAGEEVYMLSEQYRMHPHISHFPRHIFYRGNLLDGPNVQHTQYGHPLLGIVHTKIPCFQPFTVLDLDSREQRGGKSLSNSMEAHLAVYLYSTLRELTNGEAAESPVAIITPYSQQVNLLKTLFRDCLGTNFEQFVEVNTVDAFQGREANIVIFSAVRAAGSHGIGFLSDVRRMNVALTRAKHLLLVIARCESITVNPYWRDLVEHARATKAVVRVPCRGNGNKPSFGAIGDWRLEESASQPELTPQDAKATDPRKRRKIV